MKKTVLPILPSKTGSSYLDTAKNKLYLDDIFEDEDVILQSSVFRDIFKCTKKMYNKNKAIVKITANGKCIYRLFRAKAANDFDSQYVGLTTYSLYLLRDAKGDYPKEVTLSRGKYLPFLWKHPNFAVNISFKLGIFSIIVGILSLVTTIIK